MIFRGWALGCLALWLNAASALAADSLPKEALHYLLPGPDAIQGWMPAGAAQTAEGQELFSLIDGGAELFLRFGFERAATQEYADGKGGVISVEIYRMQDQAGARDVYTLKIGPGATRLPIGAAGAQGDYYFVFWQDRYFVTVTALDQAEATRKALLPFARAVAARIGTRAP